MPTAPLDPPEEVTVAYVPIMKFATMYVAEELGLFDKYGLDVNLEAVKSGTEAIAFLTEGAIDVGGIAIVTSLWNGWDQGLDIRIFALKYFRASVTKSAEKPSFAGADREGRRGAGHGEELGERVVGHGGGSSSVDGWMGWVDGWVGGWVGGWMGGWVDGWMDGWVDGWMGGWVDGWMGGWVDGWMGGWVDGWMGGWVDGWMGGWVDGWMGGWVDGWMGGWIDRRRFRRVLAAPSARPVRLRTPRPRRRRSRVGPCGGSRSGPSGRSRPA